MDVMKLMMSDYDVTMVLKRLALSQTAKLTPNGPSPNKLGCLSGTARDAIYSESRPDEMLFMEISGPARL